MLKCTRCAKKEKSLKVIFKVLFARNFRNIWKNCEAGSCLILSLTVWTNLFSVTHSGGGCVCVCVWPLCCVAPQHMKQHRVSRLRSEWHGVWCAASIHTHCADSEPTRVSQHLCDPARGWATDHSSSSLSGSGPTHIPVSLSPSQAPVTAPFWSITWPAACSTKSSASTLVKSGETFLFSQVCASRCRMSSGPVQSLHTAVHLWMNHLWSLVSQRNPSGCASAPKLLIYCWLFSASLEFVEAICSHRLSQSALVCQPYTKLCI